MKLLCIGNSGQVARALQEKSAARGIECPCTGRPDTDLKDPESLRRALDQMPADIIINAAAYTHVDDAEADREEAFAVNAEGPKHLADLCQERGLPLIHLSTDYVFNAASDHPLKETDPTGGVNVYGQSKAAGEAFVRDTHDAHIILRTSWVYSPFGANFVKTMLRLAAERGAAAVVDDQTGAPTSALDIADAILDIAAHLDQAPTPAPFGTYHYAAAGYVSWADLAAYVFELYEAETGCKIGLKRIPSSDYPTPAARPRNSRLDTQKITDTFGIHPKDWKISVKQTVDRLLAERVSRS